jgi:transposase
LYPTDLSDEEWALLELLLGKHVRLGRPPKWPRRHIADAIFYLLRSGCPWRLLPHEYPPWRTVTTQFRRWRISGAFHDAHERLGHAVRGAAGRTEQPSATILDSQTARTTGVGGPARGYDGAKRAKGRKRHLLVDTIGLIARSPGGIHGSADRGLILLVCVHAADLPDRTGAQMLLSTADHGSLPQLELVWADAAYAGAFAAQLEAERGWRLEVPRHPDRQLWRYGLKKKPKHAFRVLPRRRVIERTFAWLGQSRRLCRDYELLPQTSETMIYAAMSRIMLKRLARPTA